MPNFVDVLVDPNPNCPEGCVKRFKAESEPIPVRAVQYEGAICDLVGWSSQGGGSPCPAFGVLVEDSGAGESLLIYGGDWGVRLTPRGGGAPMGEPHLLVSRSDIVST